MDCKTLFYMRNSQNRRYMQGQNIVWETSWKILIPTRMFAITNNKSSNF